jgi:hypothetical protein
VPNKLVPNEMEHKYVTPEQEIARLAPVPPSDIVAFRHTANGYTFDGPIYIRTRVRGIDGKYEFFRDAEKDAFKRIFQILSGKTQPP